MIHPAGRLLLLLLLAGCAGGASGPVSVTDRATAAACREQANAAYSVRHRDEIYQIHDNYAPYSSIGLTDNPTRGLSDRYAQQRMIQDCIRNTGTGAERNVPPAGGNGPVPAGPSLGR